MKIKTETKMKIFISAVLCLLGVSVFAQGEDNQIEQDETKPVVIEEAVNSNLPEVKPLISADGKTLFFGRRNSPDNIHGIKDFQDVWVSHKDDQGNWQDATNLGENINDRYANAICSISKDGKTAVFHNTYKKINQPLAISKLQNNQWTVPEPLVIEDYYNHHEYSDFFLCFENAIIIMAIEREDSKGGQDLYVSRLNENGTYSVPVNLGDQINSSGEDFAPFLASDGKSLFFASTGHKGQGGSDIFMIQRKDDTWTNWTAPVNLGPNVNTNHNENYFSVTSDFRFMYLDRASPSLERDIRRLFVPDKIRPRIFKEQTVAAKVSSGKRPEYLKELLKDSEDGYPMLTDTPPSGLQKK